MSSMGIRIRQVLEQRAETLHSAKPRSGGVFYCCIRTTLLTFP